MSKLSAVEHLDPGAGLLSDYDLFLACIGYETRSRFVAETLRPSAATKVAWAFADRQLAAFDANKRWFAGAAFEYAVSSEADAEQWAEKQACLGCVSRR
jgi:hypothetical protein